MTASISLTPMRVEQIPRLVTGTKTLYIVVKAIEHSPVEIEWVAISKTYAHSTSAFAALGRLYQKELLSKSN